MKKVNIAEHIDEQLNIFISKFIDYGWNQEDSHYIVKNVDFRTQPIGIVFYSELLEYSDKEYSNNYLNTICPWIVGSSVIGTEDQKQAAEFIKKELNDMHIKQFRDEDAYYGCFNRNINGNESTLKFYINYSYPTGHWQNHVL